MAKRKAQRKPRKAGKGKMGRPRMYDEPMVPVCFQVPESLANQVRQVADEQSERLGINVSMSALFRSAMRDMVQDHDAGKLLAG